MPYDLTEPLVIGISSRALFDLEQENEMFEKQGLPAYEDYQVRHEKTSCEKARPFRW
jgi:5'-nucleotidase